MTKEISGFPGYFSNKEGDIFGPKYGISKPMAQQKDKKGYLTIRLRINNEYKYQKVHRLIGNTFIENIDNKPEINHKDGNKTNNNVSNLEWVTSHENQIHSYANGLRVPIVGEKHWTHQKPHLLAKGSKNGNSKLNEQQIIEIRNIWENTDKKYGLLIKLSRKFGIHKNKIYEIVHRKTWKHI